MNSLTTNSAAARRKNHDLDLAAYVLPAARTQGQIALMLWLSTMALFLAFCAWFESLRWLGFLIFLWWIASCVALFVVMPQNELKNLRARGSEYAINARSQPRLKTLLQKGSALIGVREPEGVLQKKAPDHPNFEVRIAGRAPHFLVVGQSAVENVVGRSGEEQRDVEQGAMQSEETQNDKPQSYETESYEPPELDCLVLRCLVHAHLGDVSRLDLLERLGQMRRLHRVLVWPVGLYALMLRAMWLPHAQANADRLALLLVKNPKLVMSALLKDFVAQHAVLRARNVGFSDVDTHLKGGGLLERSGEQMSAQYALGNALRDDTTFNARLNAITSWVNSPEYVAALEHLAEKQR